MNATFLTLVRPVHFPVSCSLHTWQKQSLCFQLIQDHQKKSIADNLCHLTFWKNKQKHEMLSPMTDCLLHHLKQSNCKAFGWSCALEAMQDLGPLEGHGQTKDKELLVPLTITKAQTPVSLLKLMTCKCKMSGCRQNCSCSNTGLACTEGCFCMAEDEGCGNPHSLTCVSDLQESKGESSFGEEL